MKIKIHRLNRDKKRVYFKELDLTKFRKIASTGNGLALQKPRGGIIEIFLEECFDHWYVESQRHNNEAVKYKRFSYKKIKKSDSDSIKNRVRDQKGKPVRIYEKKKDLYTEYKVKDWLFIGDKEWDKHIQYIKDNGITHYDYYNDEFCILD